MAFRRSGWSSSSGADQPFPGGLRLTQDELAKSLGLTQPFVSQVEAGDSYLGRETSLAIADRWRKEMKREGVTIESLLRGRRQRRQGRAA